MKKIIAVTTFMLSGAIFAQEQGLPVIPSSGKNVESFIPKGWKEIVSATGDLNTDGFDDVVLAVENTDPKWFVKNPDEIGEDILNLNERCLILLFKSEDGYKLANSSYSFLPLANDIHSPCLADPLLENGSISIKDNVLCVEFSIWVSCGSYEVTRQAFKFRYEKGAFQLIGYDELEFSRASGEEVVESTNLLTGIKLITTGGNIFDYEENSNYNNSFTVSCRFCTKRAAGT